MRKRLLRKLIRGWIYFWHFFGKHFWSYFGNTQEYDISVCIVPGCRMVKKVPRQ